MPALVFHTAVFASSAADGKRAKELAGRAVRGFAGGQRDAVRRVARLGCATSAALGRTRGYAAARAGFGARRRLADYTGLWQTL